MEKINTIHFNIFFVSFRIFLFEKHNTKKNHAINLTKKNFKSDKSTHVQKLNNMERALFIHNVSRNTMEEMNKNAIKYL